MASNGRGATVLQERDHVARTPVYGAAIVLALLLATCAVVTWVAAGSAPFHIGRRAATDIKEVPKDVNTIDMALFSADLPARGNPDETRRALESYGWVDRDRGIIRIPVRRAMEMLAESGHVR